MAAYNYRWPSEWTGQPSTAGAIGQLQAQLAELERKIDAFKSKSIQNTHYYQQQPSTTPDYYHTEWLNHQDYSWSYDSQSQDYAPESSYTGGYSYPYPPQQKDTSTLELLNHYVEQLERKNLENGCAYTNQIETWTNNQENYAQTFSYLPPQSQEPRSNFEKLLIEATERMEKASEQMEMRMNNQEIFVPSPSYPLEPSSQPQLYEFSNQQPSQPQEKPNLEELLTRFLENTDTIAVSNEATILNLEKQMEQPASADYCLHYALPSIAEINPMEKEKEQCTADTLCGSKEAYEVLGQGLDYQVEQEASALKDQPFNSLPNGIEINPKREGEEFGKTLTLHIGEESKESVGENLKRSHPDWKDDRYNGKKRVKIYPREEEIILKVFNKIKILNFCEDCYRVSVVNYATNKSDEGSYFLPIDKDEFVGGPQYCYDAKKIKEKTTRRHSMTIFAYEPD